MSRQNDALANFGATTNEELAVTTSNSLPVNTDLRSECSPAFLLLQNVGTVPVYYRLALQDDAPNSCQTTSGGYTGILAAGNADKDGTGGAITFSGYTGGLSFRTLSGTGKVNIAVSGRLGE
jgi:hypothetical protein